MLSRMLGPLSVICLGAVAMYVFFAESGDASSYAAASSGSRSPLFSGAGPAKSGGAIRR